MRWDNSIDPPPNDGMTWLKIDTKTIGDTKNVDKEAIGNATIEKIVAEGVYNLSCVVTKIIELDNGFVLRVADGTKARIKSKIEDGGYFNLTRNAHSKNKYYVDVYVGDTDLLHRIVEIKLAKGTFLHLGGVWCRREKGGVGQFHFVLEDAIDRKATIEVLQEGDERMKKIWERMEQESSSEESSQVNESSSLATTQVPSDFDADTEYVKLFVQELNKNLVKLDTQVVSSQSSIMSEKGDYEEKHRGGVRQYEDDETSELYFIRMKKWQENVTSSCDNQSVLDGGFVYQESDNLCNDEGIARQSSVRSSCSVKETTSCYEVENGVKKGSFGGLSDIEMASEDELGLIRFQGTSQRSASISRSQSHFMKVNEIDENVSYQTCFIQTKKIQERYRSQGKSDNEVVAQDEIRTVHVKEMQISNNNHGITITNPKEMKISNNNEITTTLPEEKQRLKKIHPKRKKPEVETNLNRRNTDGSLTVKKRIKHIIPVEKLKKSVIQNDNLQIDSRQTGVIEENTESLPNFLEVQGGYFDTPQYILGAISSHQIGDVESHTSRGNNYLTENAFRSDVCNEAMDTKAQAVGDSSIQLKLGSSLKQKVGKKHRLSKHRSNRNKLSRLASDTQTKLRSPTSCVPEATSNMPTLEETTSSSNTPLHLLTSKGPSSQTPLHLLTSESPSSQTPLHLLTGRGGGLVSNHLSDSQEEDMLLLPSDSEKEDMLLLPSDDENIVSNDESPNISQNSGRIVTFSNESSKLTLEDLASCHSGTHKLDATVEAVYSELGGSYSELSPTNILFGRCLTCGKFDALHTFPVDFQGVGYACCFRGGLTEVVRVFHVVLALCDGTRGPSSPVFVLVSNQHVEEVMGCCPAKFQRLDGVQRRELVDRMRGWQGCALELGVSVLKTEAGQGSEFHVVRSKILEDSECL